MSRLLLSRISMSRILFCVVIFVLSIVSDTLYAQSVQLPTFGYSGVATTVSVPDRGSTYMGGITRSASGSNEYGIPMTPFRNRSMGSEVSTGSHSMSVYIHDFESMDEQILGSSSPARSGKVLANGEKNLPFRLVSTEARKAQSGAGAMGQVAVKIRKKSAVETPSDAPLVMSGRKSNRSAVANLPPEK